MDIIIQFMNGLLDFQSYVLLPMIMLILCLVRGMRFRKAFKYCLTLGIGFIGIFMTFDYFVLKLSPVLSSIIERTGMEKEVLDVGWPPLAAMAWEFKLAPLLIFVFLAVNIMMLVMKLTKTINIDIWNYWHFIFTSQMVYFISGNMFMAIAAGYDYKAVSELAVNMAAVVYILPKMASILGEGLIPICDGMKEYMMRKFPTMQGTYIGMDLAVLMGDPAVIVTGILFIPITVVLALILPGINFIPLGDLPNMIGYAVIIVVACNGNIFRAFIAGIPTIVAKLYIASSMAETYTQVAREAAINVGSHTGEITGFLDGGNVLRYTAIQLFSGSTIGIILAFVMGILIYYLYRNKVKN